MQESIKEILGKRCRRSIAIILSVVEAETDKDSESFRAVRKVVLDQVNEFHDLCLDILESLDSDTVIVNEAYIQKMDEMYELVSRLYEEDLEEYGSAI